MLAKVANDNAGGLIKRGAGDIFASKLAPTEGAHKTAVMHSGIAVSCRYSDGNVIHARSVVLN